MCIRDSVLRWFPSKGGQGHRRDGRVKIELKKPPVDGHNHNEAEDSDEQPADERYRPQGDRFKKAAAFHRVNDFLWENRLLCRTESGCVHNRGNKPLDDIEKGHHQFQPIGYNALGDGKPDKQLQRVLRLFHLGKAAAGAHDAHYKEQH